MNMAVVALLSNTRSTGLTKLLPRIRNFIVEHSNIFHVEISHVGEVPDALMLIARAQPEVLVINGGDGTVQAVLTALVHDRPFVGQIEPPLAILACDKKSFIASDYTTFGKPLQNLARISALVANHTLGKYLVRRALIALDDGKRQRSVIGTSVTVNCSHGPMHIVLCKNEIIKNSFASVEISTSALENYGALHFIGVEPGWLARIKTKLSRKRNFILNGVHQRNSDEIRFEGYKPTVRLDGEQFEAATGSGLMLRSTPLQTFVKLAA